MASRLHEPQLLIITAENKIPKIPFYSGYGIRTVRPVSATAIKQLLSKNNYYCKKLTLMIPAFQFLFLALFILPAIFFVITLQNTLKAISPENRKMPFANVWLIFIPLFNFYWQFVVVNRVAQSIGMECEKLHIPVKDSKPTFKLGLAWSMCYILFLIPVLKLWMSIIIIPTCIIYWIKVNQYRKLIIQNQNTFLLDAERNIFYGDKVV